MSKEIAAGSSEGGLVYLKYNYRYRSQFGKSNDEWHEAIEATSDELLGTYMKSEDEAMITTFGARDKRRLNRVFDVIGFIYLDYCFAARKQGTKRKLTTMTSSVAMKPKRAKVLTHQPKLHSLEKAAALSATKKMEVD
jgi:tRNA A37 N6-isopentenylltransferase MiaA